ncbi:PHB depolymerase family esterase [Paenibacillus mucilaginosus]|nr:PHB depolymerase family esterase [Paenibacillus mucilaginosus]MCG7216739.1 hypothetical protein [Paenibacillus mucilaginosus]WDM25145.1 hypothetical protein KCX80_22055 [Paenibacillus mucilaginosus]
MTEVDRMPDLNRFTGEPMRLTKAYAIGPVRSGPAIPGRVNPEAPDWWSGRLEEERPDALELTGPGGRMAAPCRRLDRIDPRSRELDLTGYRLEEGESLFLAARLQCDRDRKLLFRCFEIKGRIWIGGELVYCDSGPFLIPLCEGEHGILIEFTELRADRSLRISDPEEEAARQPHPLYEEFLNRNVRRRAVLVHEFKSLAQGPEHTVFLLAADRTEVDDGQPAALNVRNDHGRVIASLELPFHRVISVDLEGLRSLTRSLLCFEIRYADIQGNGHSLSAPLIVNPLDALIRPAKREWEQLQEGREIPGDDRATIEGILRELEAIREEERGALKDEKPRIAWEYADYLPACLAAVREGRPIREAAYPRRLADDYFVSELDGALVRCTLLLPPGYSEGDSFPLIVLLPVGHEELFLPDFRDGFLSGVETGAVLATFSCRGVTMGGCIGEAAFLEGLDYICSRYRIDPARITLTGYSNGASTAWALAEAYPDRFAAISVTAGVPYLPNLVNLQHLPILNLCGDEDYLLEEAYTLPAAALPWHHSGVLETGSNHWDTKGFHYLPFTLNWLLQHRKREDPPAVRFRTAIGRHRRSFWLEVTSYEAASAAELTGERTAPGSYVITTAGTSGFKLHPSSRAGGRPVQAVIDGQRFTVQPGSAGELQFRKGTDGAWRQVSGTDILQADLPSHGTGILGIYNSGVDVLIPGEWGTEEEERAVRRALDVLARPKTATWDPVVYVDYPQLTLGPGFPRERLARRSWIWAGCGSSQLDWLRAEVPDGLRAELRDEGFGLGGRFYPGPYCVLFIQPNPLNPARKALFAFATSPELFGKHLFTRKLLLPGYGSGPHPYLSKEVILYSGGRLQAMNS